MINDDVRFETNRLVALLEQSNDENVWRQILNQLIPAMISYWDVHPHSAMEMLELSTQKLPVPLAHAFVRTVVAGWKKKLTYDPNAGGVADHCYLSALIFSENLDLEAFVWIESVIRRTLDKELNYPRFDRMRDGKRKEAIIRSIASSHSFP